MQDQHIGKICQICNRKDYIPYSCKKCKRILCDEHYWQHSCLVNFQQPKQYTGKTTADKQYRCSLTTCNKKLFTVNHYFCQKSHRYPEQHSCSISSQNQTKCQLI